MGSFAFNSTHWVFFLGLLSSFKTSLFLNVDVVDVNNNVCNTTDSNNGDDNDEKSIDDQADAVDAVDGDDSSTSGIKTLDKVGVFFSTFESNLPFLFFVGVSNIISLVLAIMVSPKNECLRTTVCYCSGGGDCTLPALRVFFVPVSIEGHTTNGSVVKRC